jgi:hypothetical protein
MTLARPEIAPPIGKTPLMSTPPARVTGINVESGFTATLARTSGAMFG